MKQDLGVLHLVYFRVFGRPSQHPPASPAHNESARAALERSLRSQGVDQRLARLSLRATCPEHARWGAGWDGG